jgi:hypothetical protein
MNDGQCQGKPDPECGGSDSQDLPIVSAFLLAVLIGPPHEVARDRVRGSLFDFVEAERVADRRRRGPNVVLAYLFFPGVTAVCGQRVVLSVGVTELAR